MKRKLLIIAAVMFLPLMDCDNPDSSTPTNPISPGDVASSSAPADHTIDKKGVRHKEGLKEATVNCVSCHGNDLRGGTAGVSCYKCHGKKWH